MLNFPWVVLTEVLMTAFIIWIISYLRKNTASMGLRVISISLLSLDMMASMFDSLLYYTISPKGFLGAIIAFNISMLFMSIALVYIFLTGINSKTSSLTVRRSLGFSLILVWNEVSMALFLRIMAYYTAAISSSLAPVQFFSLSVTNILFLLPMIVEMVFFIARSGFGGLERRLMISVLLMQIADPAVLGNSSAVFPLLIAYSILMLVSIYISFSYAFDKRGTLATHERKMISWFIVIIVISVAGVAEPLIVTKPFGISWTILGVSMIISMFYYFLIVLEFFRKSDGKQSKKIEASSSPSS